MIGDITVSLDSDTPVDRGALERHTAASGAVVMGRRTFDIVDQVWTAERGYGAGQDGRPPFFVVTSTAPGTHRLAGVARLPLRARRNSWVSGPHCSHGPDGTGCTRRPWRSRRARTSTYRVDRS